MIFGLFLLYLSYEITSSVLRRLREAALQTPSNWKKTPLLSTFRHVQPKSIQKTNQCQTEREFTTSTTGLLRQESFEWYISKKYLRSASAVLREIELDPASSDKKSSRSSNPLD
jgi:hypothetical protein